jgi:hypothetical protein
MFIMTDEETVIMPANDENEMNKPEVQEKLRKEPTEE